MYKKHLVFLIVAAAIIRLVTASLLELGNDEVYYYTYALHLQSNYFDHPPAVAFLIRFFTFNLAFKSEVFIRLGAIAFAAIGTLISFNIGCLVKDEKTGWFAAILYNTSIYTSIIAGLFILPDSPQVVFWLASLYCMLQLVKPAAGQTNPSMWLWLTFGIASGLCIMSKIHGVFLWGAFGLYILLYDRKFFRYPGLYISFFICCLIVSPIIYWNIENHFVTWSYHSNRVEGTHFDKDSFLQTTLGQIFYNNPINVVIAVLGVMKTRSVVDKTAYRLLLLCGLPMIAVVTFMSMFNTVLPHWSGPAFLSLSFLGAAYLSSRFSERPISFLPLYIKSSLTLIVVLVAAGILLIRFYPGTIGSKDIDNYGEGDFTLDMFGWKNFNTNFETWARQQEANNVFSKDIKMVGNKWFPASHIDYYIARPMNTYVVGLGKPEDLHHYLWLNEYRGGLQPNENALCIVPSNNPSDMAEAYQEHFKEIVLLKTYYETRGGKVCRNFRVYLLKGFIPGS